MIVFDLKCDHGHVFEVWFRSSADYETQIKHKEVECPICGSIQVMKAVMAPNVGTKGNQKSESLSSSVSAKSPQSISLSDFAPSFDGMDEQASAVSGMPELPAELQEEMERVMTKVQKHVEENCEYVGDNFAEEARKIHYGETEERGIYGETSLEESEALMDEGIDVMPLPSFRKPGRTDA